MLAGRHRLHLALPGSASLCVTPSSIWGSGHGATAPVLLGHWENSAATRAASRAGSSSVNARAAALTFPRPSALCRSTAGWPVRARGGEGSACGAPPAFPQSALPPLSPISSLGVSSPCTLGACLQQQTGAAWSSGPTAAGRGRSGPRDANPGEGPAGGQGERERAMWRHQTPWPDPTGQVQSLTHAPHTRHSRPHACPTAPPPSP